MNIDALKQNLKQIRSVVKELHIFTTQLETIDKLEKQTLTEIQAKEKNLLVQAINSLKNQLLILNNSIPLLVENIGFYKSLDRSNKERQTNELVEVKYTKDNENERVSLVISDNEKKDFLENLANSSLTIRQLKKKYSENKTNEQIIRSSFYAKLSNRIFRPVSLSLVSKGYFSGLNRDLRKMNSRFVVGTYVSMIFFTMVLAMVLSLLSMVVLVIVDFSGFPIITLSQASPAETVEKYIWIILVLPVVTLIGMYLYPSLETRKIGTRINQELPFVTIHMSAIAMSGVEPINIFYILQKNNEYKYSCIEFRKILNLINFYGKDIVTALRIVSRMSPSDKFRDLLDGMATTITSGGNIHNFLDKHSETLLFDYRLEREKYTKASETFMDIYISIAIAAPMILLMLFVIIGSTGGMNFLGMDIEELSVLIILLLSLLNIGFLVFLKIKQPEI